jgi:hypothetical protein
MSWRYGIANEQKKRNVFPRESEITDESRQHAVLDNSKVLPE